MKLNHRGTEAQSNLIRLLLMPIALFSLACRNALRSFSKWNQRGIRALFRARFEKMREGIHLCLRVPFFASFLGMQERRESGKVFA